MKLIENIKLKINYEKKDLINFILKKTKISEKNIKNIEIIKKSIDARKKPDIFYNLSVAIETDKKLNNFKDIVVDKTGLNYDKIDFNGSSPIIVGFGPSGMFAGLVLSLAGFKPIILEQGECIEERSLSVENFWKNRKLNTYSNVQFGEGGAGTFSDGKLNSNISNLYCKKVINELILNGANEEIFYINKPHIGSDKLKEIVVNIRKKIIANGGQILFNTKLKNIEFDDNEIKGVNIVNVKTLERQNIQTNTVLLAIGHSAIDTFKMLKQNNVKMIQKPFAMGVRIEQLQSDINMMQYGKSDIELPPADYKLALHLPNGRSIFTFCMCPGGEVVASSSEENTIVTNGMSLSGRDKKTANSALLVNVNPEDFGSSDVLAGLDFQRKYEKLAFEIAGKNYNAPAQSVGNFLCNKNIETKECSYRPNITLCELKKCLPDFVYESLKLGIEEWKNKYKYFIKDENLLIGIESRSSCPLTIIRDENFMSSIKGLFPIGEGAGYAGGIMSSAQDGIKVAEKVIEYLKK